MYYNGLVSHHDPDQEPTMSALVTKSDQIAEFLLTPEAKGLSDVQVAERFGVHKGTVGRARVALCGPNGGFLKALPIAALVIDFKHQLRSIEGGLDAEAVDRYADAYKSGTEMPPLLVAPLGTGFAVIGGFHRATAAKKAGLTEVNCEVVEVSDAEAACLASKNNIDHGLPMTKADRRHAAERLLLIPELAELGGRELERRTGIDESVFRKIRREQKERADLEAKSLSKDDALETVNGKDHGPAEPRERAESDDDGDDTGGEESGSEAPPEVDDAAELAALPADEQSLILVHRQRHAILSALPVADIRNLMRAPVFVELHGDQLRCFVEEYLYRQAPEVAQALEALRAAHRVCQPKGKVKPILARTVELMLKQRPYDHLDLCGRCSGKGCDACYRRGFC
jgi:hypothetical protein